VKHYTFKERGVFILVSVNTYFSGAGIGDVGLLDAGIDIHQAFELDAEAVKTYRHNIGDHVKHCDLTQELVSEQDDVDGMIFTYPCTKYSTISDIHKSRTGDELFLHALRHIALKQPEFYAIENVPGMRAFPLVMEAMSKLPDYYTQVFCPIKTETWLPQRRDRLIIIATRKPFNFRPPEKQHSIVPLSSILEENPDITYPKAIYERMAGNYRDLPIISDPSKGDIAPTCVAHYSKDKSTRLVVDKRFPLGVRPYSVREFARLQGLPDWFEFPVSNTNAYKQIGNGVSTVTWRWLGQEINRYFNYQSSF
jgi:DNA (cytosine-5)-methyltransferase 1